VIDRPDAATLLEAMATTLSEEVLPNTSGSAGHSVRVIANLCRILAREVAQGADAAARTEASLRALLGRDAGLVDLISELDRRLRDSDPEFDARARAALLADVERRLAIDRPGYGS